MRYIVGRNLDGTHYEVAHVPGCHLASLIREEHRRYFADKRQALAAATEHRIGDCCISRDRDS